MMRVIGMNIVELFGNGVGTAISSRIFFAFLGELDNLEKFIFLFDW